VSVPLVVSVAPASPAAEAGLAVGDEVLAINGEVPRDVIQWRLLTDDADLEVEIRRGGLQHTVEVFKAAGEPFGAEVSSALFDQVRTEVHQAGLFNIAGLNDGQRHAALNTICPQTLFPYATRVITSLVADGGFPPLVLQPINFESVYQQRLADAAKGQSPAGDLEVQGNA
jgi:hypothetical protein